MTPIAQEFEDAMFKYTQRARRGMHAIYTQTHKTSGITRWEVIRVRELPAHTWPNGITSPAHEAYPPATAWGRAGWTLFTLEAATALLTTLTIA